NDRWYVQYVRWIGNVLQGDFGQSYTFKRDVASIIGERALNTFYLSLVSVMLLYLIAIPLGMLAGRYQNSKLDKGIVFYSFVSYAIPTFVLALLFIYI